MNYLSAKDPAAGPPAAPMRPRRKAPAQFVPAPSARAARAEQRVPMTRLRARIAERMVQAQATQALLTSFNEVDLKAVNEIREPLQGSIREAVRREARLHVVLRQGLRRGVEEVSRRSMPRSMAMTSFITSTIDVGVAVSTDRGLIVPVLRDADQLSFADIEKSIANFASRARAGSITIEELTGGTFTITNGGVFGSLLSTPIVNSPQSAILGMHKIQDRPVVVDGQVVVRPMMYVALTYDHRIIDGREAVQFLVTVKQCLGGSGAHGAAHMSDVI